MKVLKISNLTLLVDAGPTDYPDAPRWEAEQVIGRLNDAIGDMLGHPQLVEGLEASYVDDGEEDNES